ncbi:MULTISPECIES: MlaC/ttg2D family ABC transporter substrate-binding protein [Pseudomonadaceae]|jgi:phospholipid transport system substrate-binding protein|uniref:Phospholipid transport system substrate-binding protein n=2 Tax=Pseudomonadaceae TaxID=135621 RepID=A0A1H2N8A2_9PSED|nr:MULTISPECIES: ABC transporter substrate-binding protein [Pseudomonas]ATH83561.1 toluene tolerance protein [Pseudomonas mendocina]EJO94154.1 toluene tolerance family protein [Pseudomonas mendocina DLHK]MBF8159654.1 ABC transporter substrate-binding protein [Pseudomonas mendocina]UTH32577.1 ABC transporter substrate-binding protein [Pseudomonas hydrolytica]UZZ13406.1 ABC transporter substrate-binding protein [Pseudomonas mendocina]
MLKTLRNSLFALLAAMPLLALAAPSAHEVVQQTTDTLLADLKANKEQYRSNPAAFYDSLNQILGPVVDVDGISRGVMTVRYSRQASPEQMSRFQENFKRSLMQFYGNALLEYDNQDIRVLPAGKQDAERTSVGMEIRDAKGAVYPLSYTMVAMDGTWKLRNVIINGINVGKLFRDQFAQSMQNNRNDLDKVIDTWADTVARARQARGES